MELNFEKKFAASLSIVSNVFLIVVKLILGFLSGSVSVISEALHSLGDLIASALAFFSVVLSSKPADNDHPFGHGKYEDLSGFFEALLIIGTAIYIFYFAGKKIIAIMQGSFHTVDTNIACYAMIFSIIINFLVSTYLLKVAKKSDSLALLSDAEHLRSDIYTSTGIIFGLITVKLTNLYIFDPIFAIAFGILIITTGFKIARNALNNLLDGSLSKEDKQMIKDVIEDFKQKGLIKLKTLNTTKLGNKKTIQLTISFDKNMTLGSAHCICDEIEHAIEEKLHDVLIIIHQEPM